MIKGSKKHHDYSCYSYKGLCSFRNKKPARLCDSFRRAVPFVVHPQNKNKPKDTKAKDQMIFSPMVCFCLTGGLILNNQYILFNK